jgi:hypothetical protein
MLEKKVEKQEEFKNRIAWTTGIVVTALLLVDQIGRIYNTFFS